ncbi:heterokaryon incompatibility protein-domain-containing protein [Lenzites betulinus]|nr:heterokaryon incompatibility protein-domain-containing protein [Lenzites betulinus]
MWLLSTKRLELVFFNRPDQVPGGYAILSHVWQKSEQSFQDIKKLLSPPVFYDDPRISAKVCGCARTAESYGFHWLWIDASCIDKTSSAELSEAINSMFDWYAAARICFAYVQDVPESCVLAASGSAFRLSRWFTRGWTLQELLAPRCLIFLSETWTFLGTKASLASLLAEITGIDVEILTFRRDIQQVSVARRMSWASRRETTRPEDEAYCLLGIFGITMPTIYGEGREDFRRLQGEILKHSPDQSLFAWGRALPSGSPSAQLGRDIRDPASALFANSPRDFESSAEYQPIPRASIARLIKTTIDVPLCDILHDPEFTITNCGVRCRLVIVDISPFVLALLACRTASGDCVGLLMHQRQGTQGEGSQYLVGAICNSVATRPTSTWSELPWNITRPKSYRLLHITPSSLADILERTTYKVHDKPPFIVTGASRTVYVTYSLSFTHAHPWMRLLEPEPQRIMLPPWLSDQLRRYNFYLDPSSSDLSPPGEDGRSRRDLHVVNNITGEVFVIHLERYQVWLCASVSIIPVGSSSPHYVPRTLDPGSLLPRAFEEDSLGDGSHPSSLQHCIRFWHNGSKAFGDEARIVRLTFTRWPTADRYCLDIALEGHVYAPLTCDALTGGPHPRLSRKVAHRRSHKTGLLASPTTAYASLRRKWRHKLVVAAMTSYVGRHPADLQVHTVSSSTLHMDLEPPLPRTEENGIRVFNAKRGSLSLRKARRSSEAYVPMLSIVNFSLTNCGYTGDGRKSERIEILL